ncbi:MAG TPA: CocE/NonD family hydrolase [Ramlibacter sp.]|nr:CocE/NonD family hydrolase [Ramlibacter sp.]
MEQSRGRTLLPWGRAGSRMFIGAFVALVLGLGAQARTAYPGGVWEPGPARYGTAVVDDVPVTMDDGVVLRASIAYPTDPATGQRAAGRFPVVIEQTPYVRLGQAIVPNAFLTERGYIYVVVRARGTGASGGELAFFSARDGLDGKAIVDWAAHRLEGSDGRIGLVGCSWAGGLAATSAAYVGRDSPVKAVVAPCMGLTGLHRQTLLVSGLPTTRMATFATGLLPYVGNTQTARDTMNGLSQDIMAGGGPAYEGAYWRDRRPVRFAKNIVDNGIPMLLWTGWRDYVDTGAIRTYVALQNAYAGRPLDAPMTASQPVTPRYQIVVGPWPHAEGLDVGLYLQWLETWLKGVDTGIQKTRTPMHLYEMGTDRWINVRGLPLVASYTAWRLDRSGQLTASTPQRSGSEALAWTDPAEAGGKLTFTTPPLAAGVTLAGPMSATIYASSSNTNLALIAKLLDVAPDGTATEISRGVMLGSQRELDRSLSWSDRNGKATWPWQALKRDDYLAPGRVYRFDVLFSPRQWGVKPDHKLRLELTTQSPQDVCPREGLPPRAGTDVCGLTAPQRTTVPGGKYTIMLGGKWPSALNLPQLPWKAFPEARTGPMPTTWHENQRQIVNRGFTLPLDWDSGK